MCRLIRIFFVTADLRHHVGNSFEFDWVGPADARIFVFTVGLFNFQKL